MRVANKYVINQYGFPSDKLPDQFVGPLEEESIEFLFGVVVRMDERMAQREIGTNQ